MHKGEMPAKFFAGGFTGAMVSSYSVQVLCESAFVLEGRRLCRLCHLLMGAAAR